MKPIVPMNKRAEASYENHIENNKYLERKADRIQCGNISFNVDDIDFEITDLNTLHPTITMGSEKSNRTAYYDFNFYSNHGVGRFYAISLSSFFGNDIITIRLYYGSNYYRHKSYKYLKYILYKNSVKFAQSTNYDNENVRLAKKTYSLTELGPQFRYWSQ